MKRKPATRVFQHFSFRRHDHAEPIRRSVVTRPKVKRAEQEKCDSRRFAIIRGGISHVSAHIPYTNLSCDVFKGHFWDVFLMEAYAMIKK